ncbi:putative L,D-transpeptidase ErfK/SrfK [Methylocystis sp. MJC1]|jgi:lipoprotein-anchoring transpeptidase ErfK/SrfK|uniref:L,D-transpeptidase n=2 Tax=Methylocystis sp. MJC1 TaxID=2654282 RepID=UPI001FEF083D|nr:L,D-transpeptidase [Methylocystis sp. MJC1]KAF2992571.1 putative L,D-transpeptidase ErfK/SrfK [Methylocystis sp. MJC1]
MTRSQWFFVMRKRTFFFGCAVWAASAALLVASARANPVITAAPPYPGYYQQQSPLGGGLIEALVGGDPRPVRYAAPPAAYPNPRTQTAAYAPQSVEMERAADPRYMRADVEYSGAEAPGTIVVDTSNKFLYLVHGRGHATRYGIGVGRPGFEWSGVKTVSRKAEWPDWTPPAEMLARRPDLPRHMEGGPANPLGARALYLGSSLYRIHGTNEPHTIGQNVSSGCIRMMNDDVVDLYNHVGVGTRVVVR